MKVGLRMEDTLCRSKWIVGVDQVAAGLRSFWTPSVVGILPDLRYLLLSSCVRLS